MKNESEIELNLFLYNRVYRTWWQENILGTHRSGWVGDLLILTQELLDESSQ